jgi:hypothetical protein
MKPGSRLFIFAAVCITTAIILNGGCKKKGDTIVAVMSHEAPEIAAIPDQATDAGALFSLDLSTYVTDKDDIADLTFVALNGGAFTGAVYNNIFTRAGTFAINFSVIDTDGAVGLGSFNVTVSRQGWISIPGTRPGVDYPNPRYDSAMAFDSVRNVVVLFGGVDYDGNNYSDTWEWDGTTWTNVSPSGLEGTDFPAARNRHAMAFNGTDVVLFGGSTGNTETWEWNGTTWTDVSPAGVAGTDFPTGRNNHAMAFDGTKVVLFGGSSGNTETWEWDNGAWTDVSPGGVAGTDYPTGRNNHAMAYNGTNVVLFGGSTGGTETWEWDNGAWTDVSPAGVAGTDFPTTRIQHVMAFDGTNVVLFGGGTSPDWNETWTWDGGNWSDSSPAGTEGVDNPYGCARAAMAYDSTRGVVVVFGGDRWWGSGTYESNTWGWDGSAWSNESPQGAEGVSLPSPRRNHAMAFDSVRNVVVLFGGEQGGDNGPEHYFDDTWEWDGITWTNVSPAGNSGTDYPSARRGHAMVFDSDRGVVVLFGGEFNESENYSDIWEWDGTTWTDVSPTSGTAGVDFPIERRFHSMAYDSSRQVVVMFGGDFEWATYMFGDLWEWDGNAGTWSKVALAGAPGVNYPEKRRNHAMVYDSISGAVVMFGGYDKDIDVFYDDTWTWDGSQWVDISPPGVAGINFPDLRRHHKMAYDSDSGVIVLFGAEDKNWEPLGDTWEFDGYSWSPGRAVGSSIPNARRAHAMAYDSNRGVVVMFGGNETSDDETCVNDTWEY